MSKLTKIKYCYKFLRLLCLALLITAFYLINPVYADILECVPGSSNGKAHNPECPNGKLSRNDINVNCMANQSLNNCVDIMPAQNKGQVVRIPEDVCYRNEGWSNKRNHNGMDYALPQGAGVVAAADGEVIWAGSDCGSQARGNGIHVKIKHEMKVQQQSDDGAIVPSGATQCFITSYLHLSKVTISNKVTVKKGQKIGEVGGTGCRGDRIDIVYPVHLHFEMRLCNGTVINPMCPALGDLCPGNTTTNEEGETEKAFDPDKCRDCDKNKAACVKGDYPFTPDGSVGGIDYHQEVKSDKNCTVSNYKESFKTCVFCEIFRVLFDTASNVAAKSFTVLSPAVSSVLIIAMALWLSLTVLKYISSFEVKEPRQMIKEILSKVLLVLFILVILSFGPLTFFKYTLEPIFNTGMRLAILTSSNSDMINCNDYKVLTMAEGGGLPESMGQSILCVVKTIQDSFLDILALGSTAICIGFFEKSVSGIPIFPHFGYVLTGLGLWVAAMLILIIYPWLLIDSVLKISISVSLLPAGIGAYAFGPTRKYSSKLWETFLNSMFTFVFLSIILFVLISMINDTIEQADLQDLMLENADYLSQDNLLKRIGWWTTTFLQVCFAILLGWAVLGEGSDFAGDFSSGMSIGSIGSNVGTTAMSGVKGVGLPVIKGTAKAGKAAGSAVGSTIKEKANTAKIERQARSIKNSKHSTIDKDGNITQSYTSWSGKKVTRTLNVDANGNKVITNSKTDSKGNVTTTTADKFMTVASTKDKNGNVVREDFQMKAAGTKYMVNKDGTVNQIAINAMMQNSLHSPEMVQKAIMIQVMKERFGEGKGLNKNFNAQNIQMTKDEKGNNVIEMVQKNKDGTTQRAKMVMGEKRALVEIENISKDGRSSNTISSDGVFKKSEDKKFDKDGNVTQATQNYDIVDTYKGGRPIDSHGTFSKKIQDAGTMYSDDDIDVIKKLFMKYGELSYVPGILK